MYMAAVLCFFVSIISQREFLNAVSIKNTNILSFSAL